MTTWTPEELDRIGDVEEVRIASVRADGTLRKPVIVWVIRYGDDLYLRSVNGRGAAWFRGVLDRHEGRLWGDSLERDVTFVESDEHHEALDAAYRTKYEGRYPGIVPSILTPEARGATLKLVPR